ncbi:MAG: carbon-nitrogen hydrolase family protein [Acidobacteriota bacterium]
MRVGYYQFNVKPKNIQDNTNRLRDNLRRVKKSVRENRFDLLVLPELFSTGYIFDSKSEIAAYAEAVPGGFTTVTLVQICREINCFIIAGVLEKDNNDIFNTAVLVGPNGYYGKHRKTVLTKYEATMFSRGSDFKVFDINGVKIGIAICVESLFPEVGRFMMSQGCQILCIPASFNNTIGLEVIKTRAVENMMHVILSNRIGQEFGSEHKADFRGESSIFDCYGQVLAKSNEEETIVLTDIDTNVCNRHDEIFDDYFKEFRHIKRTLRNSQVPNLILSRF